MDARFRKLRELYRNAERKDDCLICHLAPNAKGYSNLSLGRANKYRAHRFVYETIVGPLAADRNVLHTCDNRRCISMLHLYAGSARQNTADMMTRARGANQYRTNYNWRR